MDDVPSRASAARRTEPQFDEFWRRLSAPATRDGTMRGYLLRFVAGFLVVVLAAVATWPLLPRRYEATAVVVLHPSAGDMDPSQSQFLRQPLDDNAIQSEVDRIESPAMVAGVINSLGLLRDPEFNGTAPGLRARLHLSPAAAEPPTLDAVTRRVSTALNVWRDRRSYTVNLGFQAREPAKAAAMTQALLDAYAADQVARKRSALDTLNQWMLDRVRTLRLKAAQSEQAEKTFLVDSGLIDASAQAALESQLNALSAELAQTRSRTIEAQTRTAALEDMRKAGTLDSAPDVLASPFVQRLKETLAAAIAKPAVWDPEAKGIAAQIDAEAARIVRGAEVDARSWSERERLLQQEMTGVQGQLTQRRLAGFRLADLKREADADAAVLTDALVRLKGLALKSGAATPDIEILARPSVPTKPVFPNPMFALIGTFLAALCGGAIMIWRPLLGAARRLLAG